MPAPSKVQNIGMTTTPTSSLDSNPLKFGTYQYPKDVFENQQLGHFMIFYVNKTDRTKYVYGKNAQQRNTIIDKMLMSAGLNSLDTDTLKLREVYLFQILGGLIKLD